MFFNKSPETLSSDAQTKLYRNIAFESQGATLRGRLNLPEERSKKYPVLIMAHGYTTTINEMTTDKYHFGQFAPHIKSPILMIVAINDEMNGADPGVTHEFFKMNEQPKVWVDIDGGHFGLLHYPSSLF
jgi:cephalosporin-C deacetylase-like acetyl esterase